MNAIRFSIWLVNPHAQVGVPKVYRGSQENANLSCLNRPLTKENQCFSNFGVHMNYLGIWLNAHSGSCSPHWLHPEYQGSRQGAFWTLPLTLFHFSFSPKRPPSFYTYSWSHCNNPHKSVLTGPPQSLITLCAIPIGTFPKQAATLQEKASQLTHVKC